MVTRNYCKCVDIYRKFALYCREGGVGVESL